MKLEDLNFKQLDKILKNIITAMLQAEGKSPEEIKQFIEKNEEKFNSHTETIINAGIERAKKNNKLIKEEYKRDNVKKNLKIAYITKFLDPLNKKEKILNKYINPLIKKKKRKDALKNVNKLYEEFKQKQQAKNIMLNNMAKNLRKRISKEYKDLFSEKETKDLFKINDNLTFIRKTKEEISKKILAEINSKAGSVDANNKFHEDKIKAQTFHNLEKTFTEFKDEMNKVKKDIQKIKDNNGKTEIDTDKATLAEMLKVISDNKDNQPKNDDNSKNDENETIKKGLLSIASSLSSAIIFNGVKRVISTVYNKQPLKPNSFKAEAAKMLIAGVCTGYLWKERETVQKNQSLIAASATVGSCAGLFKPL